jgi:hypothetical protein
MLGHERAPNAIGWGILAKRPDFYPEFLPWADPNLRPNEVAPQDWIPLLRRGLGEHFYLVCPRKQFPSKCDGESITKPPSGEWPPP